ncbi:MAG TPA: tetratricopeptide repeat protein, partial [Desulfobacteraceae bacterium]|nr:tetratricopeptide repeat protein [Desulfobacteraceae bacterium]
YAVVIGYDRNEEIIYLHSGSRRNEKLSFRVFNNTWARSGFWGLLVLPSSQMPVSTDYRKWLDAAVGLELAGQWRAAAAAYEKAGEQWPQSANIWIGLGNSRFALHDLPGAARAFEKAIKNRPDSGVAYNNLAKTLAAMGHYEKGLAAARHAVMLGGPFLEQFRNTLAETKEEIPSSPVSP